MMIGFTGRRSVGKSEAAKVLIAGGFVPVHALGGGRAAAEAYLVHIGASKSEAHEMVYGALKDVPCDLLPGNAKPRDFLEPFGNWWGTKMGPEWTLGAELRRIKRDLPFASIVVESLVYEADLFRAAGGRIVRITRPGTAGPAGMMTDAAEATIVADAEIVNDGSLEDLARAVGALIP